MKPKAGMRVIEEYELVGCFGFNGPLRSISAYIGPSPKEREKEERKYR